MPTIRPIVQTSEFLSRQIEALIAASVSIQLSDVPLLVVGTYYRVLTALLDGSSMPWAHGYYSTFYILN